jgi:CRP/FNR family transcriptional regulator, anaerobic regulatory protein
MNPNSPGLMERLATASPSLAGLSPSLATECAATVHLIRLPAGAPVFSEDDACSGFPIVLAGRVRICRTLENGREIALYEVTAGESCVLSASCMLGSTPYRVRGLCATDAEIAMIPRSTFDRLVAEHRTFREEVLRVFADRIVQLMELVESIGFQRLDRRLAAALLGKGTRLAASHQTIAGELGASRESVSRLLKQFEHGGCIQLGRGAIEIIDAAALRRIAAGESGFALEPARPLSTETEN